MLIEAVKAPPSLSPSSPLSPKRSKAVRKGGRESAGTGCCWERRRFLSSLYHGSAEEDDENDDVGKRDDEDDDDDDVVDEKAEV